MVASGYPFVSHDVTSEKSSLFTWTHVETWEYLGFICLALFIHMSNPCSVLVSRRQTYCTGHSASMGLSEFSARGGPCLESVGDGSVGATDIEYVKVFSVLAGQRALLF